MNDSGKFNPNVTVGKIITGLIAIYRMAALLAKFRITYSDLTIIKDVNQAPKEETKRWFDNLVRDFIGRDQLPSK